MADYISREAAVAIFRAKADMGVLTPAQTYFNRAADMIALLPAADVEPVRHSYWESYDASQYMGTDEFGEPKWRPGRFYICDNRRCRRKTVVKSNYCPDCGCRMDLEDGNNDD